MEGSKANVTSKKEVFQCSQIGRKWTQLFYSPVNQLQGQIPWLSLFQHLGNLALLL